MSEIAKSQGFKVTTLLTKDATRERVSSAIKSATKELKPGDIFMVSYSGHGGQLPDRNDDEIDALDETWCLYNGQLVDDELNMLLAEFEQGVRVLAFSDSCHSGTVTKAAYFSQEIDTRTTNVDIKGNVYRFAPDEVLMHTYSLNRQFYDKILSDEKLKESEDRVKASVLLISGCEDNQLSMDGKFNGLFTGTLLKVWKGGSFKKGYRKFHKEILGRMPPDQSPNYYTVGERNRSFERQKPFTI